jgi:hypothetical protein
MKIKKGLEATREKNTVAYFKVLPPWLVSLYIKG